jgi:hypothetical protein
VSGVDPGHIRPLLFNDGLHGPRRLIRIDIAKFPPINHNHLIHHLFGFLYPGNQLPLQFFDLNSLSFFFYALIGTQTMP